MSMISSQIDELRELAGDGSMEWATGPIRASVLRDAADTIWQLRDDLQRTNDAVQDAEHDESMAWDRVRKAEAENAKLLEELAKARDPQRIGGQADPSSFVYAIEQLREFRWQHATNDEDAIPYINNVVVAHERENAKLRELVANVHEALCLDKTTLFREAIIKSLEYDMRELGIEVDG